MMKKIMLLPTIIVLLVPLFINPKNPVPVGAVSGSEPLTNSSISYLYNEGGRQLASLSNSDLQSYFFDDQYNIWGDITNFNETTQNFFAIPNFQKNGTYPQSICVQTAILAYLKYLEVRWGYNNSVFPLFSYNIGKYSNQAKTVIGSTPFTGAKHNFRDYDPSYVNLNGSYFKNSNYPLASSTNDYGMGEVYNELMKISYYTIKNGAGGSSIVNGIKEYLQNEKSNDNYRYSSTVVNYYTATIANQNTLFNFVSGNTYGKATAVMFGDNDYQYPNEPDRSTDLGGHAMFGIYYGISKIRKSLANYEIVTSPEMVYDWGGANYAAMPYYDIEDFFVIKLKLERMEKYGLFNWFTRWVEVTP
ncbi:MAG: hypothetical protein WC179_08090 [Candidatus Cloacimonadaceae bacterium]|jgi:hypothetical protein